MHSAFRSYAGFQPSLILGERNDKRARRMSTRAANLQLKCKLSMLMPFLVFLALSSLSSLSSPLYYTTAGDEGISCEQ